jgi:hypothetical protein
LSFKPIIEVDLIEYLVNAKFPLLTPAIHEIHTKKLNPAKSLEVMLRKADGQGELKPLDEEGAKKYRAELEKKSDVEIRQMYDVLWKANQQESLRQKEKMYFFNHQDVLADFDFWSKMTGWTLEQAIALSFGKDPRKVSWSKISAYEGISPFVKKYSELRQLALDALWWKRLYDPILPSLYIVWTEQNELSFPAELKELVIKRSGKLINWQEEHKKILELNIENVKIANETIETLKTKITELETKAASFEEKPITTRERNTFLKIIGAMAIDGYGYDPKASKSPLPREIADRLALHGIKLDTDTIRNKLQEAASELPEFAD